MARYNIEIAIRARGAKQAEAEITGLGGSVKRAASVVDTLHRALAALPIAYLVRSVAQASMEFDRIHAALRVATGGAAAGAREFQFVAKEAERLGLNLTSTAGEYAKLAAAARGTALAGEPARKIFQATAEAAAALGLSAEESAGALRAFQQMISKGTVASEELRGQLGERIPGAFQMAARAMGVTTMELGKMLQAGTVAAEDLLPKLAEEMSKTFGPEAAKNAHNLNAELNRMQTNFKLLADKAGGEMSQSIGLVNKALKALLDNFGHIRAFFALLQQGVVEFARGAVAVMSALAISIAEVGERVGAVYAFVRRTDNPFAGWVDATKKLAIDMDDFLGNLSEGFQEVAVEQFADDMGRASTAVQEVAEGVKAAGNLTQILADAAARARAEFDGIRLAEVAGAVDQPGLTGGTTFLDPGIMRGIEEMGDELSKTVKDLEGDMVQASGRVGDAFRFIRDTVVTSMAQGVADVVAGTKTAAEAMKDIFITAFAAIGAVIGNAIGGPVGAQVGASLGGMLGGLLGPNRNQPFGGGDFKAGLGGLNFETGLKNWRIGYEEMARIGREMADEVNDIFKMFGGEITSLNKDIGFIIDNGRNIVNINGVQKNFGDNFQAAMEFFILETIKAAEVAGLSDEVKNAIKKAAETAGSDFGQFQSDLAAIQEIEGFGRSDTDKALEAVTRHFDDLRETAERLGLSLEKVNNEEARQIEEILARADADRKRAEEEAAREAERLAEERREAHKAAQDARREFRQEMDLLELSVGGASEGLVNFVRAVQDLDDFLAQQQAAGVNGTGRFRELSLQGMLDDVLGPVNDILNPLDAAGEIAQRFEDIREQIAFLAEQMGIAVEPLLTLVNAAEQKELARVTQEAAEAERRLVEERQRQIQALEDLTTPDFIKRLRALQEQIAAIVGADGGIGDRMMGRGGERIDPTLGRDAIEALGRDFLQTLQQMGIEVPGLVVAMAAYNKAAAIATILELQLAGAFAGLNLDIPKLIADVTGYWDLVAKGQGAAVDGAQQFFDIQSAILDEQRAAAQDFESLWGQLSASSTTAEQKIIDDYKRLAELFKQQTTSGKVDFLEEHGFDIRNSQFPGFVDVWDEALQKWVTTPISALGSLLEMILGPMRDAALEELQGDGGLGAIRKYFDDLRTHGAGLTATQRFENVLAEFNKAIAAGEIDRAVEMARLLTGDVGIGQFGTSAQAFRDLTAQIVAALGGFLPEGAPQDLLLGVQQQAYGVLTRMETQNVTTQQILRDGFADLRNEIRQSRNEAGRVN